MDHRIAFAFAFAFAFALKFSAADISGSRSAIQET
jgi:hypothetical protein